MRVLWPEACVQGSRAEELVLVPRHGALPNDVGVETGRRPRDGGAQSTGRRRKGARDGGVLTQGAEKSRSAKTSTERGR